MITKHLELRAKQIMSPNLKGKNYSSQLQIMGGIIPLMKRRKDKLKLTRNKHRTMVTSKENERSDQGFRSLPKPQAKLEILLRLKGSSRCGVSTENNGDLWWLMVVVGNGESSWDVRNGFGRKKEEEMTFFLSYTKAKAEVLK